MFLHRFHVGTSGCLIASVLLLVASNAVVINAARPDKGPFYMHWQDRFPETELQMLDALQQGRDDAGVALVDALALPSSKLKADYVISYTQLASQVNALLTTSANDVYHNTFNQSDFDSIKKPLVAKIDALETSGSLVIAQTYDKPTPKQKHQIFTSSKLDALLLLADAKYSAFKESSTLASATEKSTMSAAVTGGFISNLLATLPTAVNAIGQIDSLVGTIDKYYTKATQIDRCGFANDMIKSEWPNVSEVQENQKTPSSLPLIACPAETDGGTSSSGGSAVPGISPAPSVSPKS